MLFIIKLYYIVILKSTCSIFWCHAFKKNKVKERSQIVEQVHQKALVLPECLQNSSLPVIHWDIMIRHCRWYSKLLFSGKLGTHNRIVNTIFPFANILPYINIYNSENVWFCVNCLRRHNYNRTRLSFDIAFYKWKHGYVLLNDSERFVFLNVFLSNKQ